VNGTSLREKKCVLRAKKEIGRSRKNQEVSDQRKMKKRHPGGRARMASTSGHRRKWMETKKTAILKKEKLREDITKRQRRGDKKRDLTLQRHVERRQGENSNKQERYRNSKAGKQK